MKTILDELVSVNKDQIASEIDSFSEERYLLFDRHLDQSCIKILDFGCNTGRGGTVLKKKNNRRIIIGADIVSERLQKVPADYHQIIDLTKNNLEDVVDNVDAIVAGEVAEHLPFLDLIHYFEIFKKIITKNGLILMTTPNPKSFLVKLGYQAALKDPSHVNIMDKYFFKTLLFKLGFEDVKIYGSGKATRIFGERFPLFGVYGSYLIITRNGH
jgi:2-polyprenyl-3-methyl-5-hydroxy-6-metoxy-1,4-benzoquinol methylase